MIPAIIPARGGSKRIKDKNIRPFAGKPIICRVIETAFASQIFDRIVVSTDSAHIAETAIKCGAEVPFIRPAELSDDYTVLADVVLHAIRFLLENGEEMEEACLIYPTAPMLKKEYLYRGLDALRKYHCDAVVSVAEYSAPVQRALTIGENGYLSTLWPEFELSRSQDLKKAYYDAGQFHWVRVNSFLETGILYMKKSYPVLLPRQLAHDIDTAEDWALAESYFTAFFRDNDN